jgi:hypothetical protein
MTEINEHSAEFYHAMKAVEQNCLGCLMKIVVDHGSVLPPLSVTGNYSLRDYCVWYKRPAMDAYLKERGLKYHSYQDEASLPPEYTELIAQLPNR